jgi:hypothetical protein
MDSTVRTASEARDYHHWLDVSQYMLYEMAENGVCWAAASGRDSTVALRVIYVL